MRRGGIMGESARSVEKDDASRAEWADIARSGAETHDVEQYRRHNGTICVAVTRGERTGIETLSVITV